MWKTSNDPYYQIRKKTRDTQEEGMETRASNVGDLREIKGSTQAKKSFTTDVSEVWKKQRRG